MTAHIKQLPEEVVQRVGILIAGLDNSDGLKRESARLELEKIGKAVSPFLIKSLNDAKERVRWEIIKAMISIRDERTVPILVRTLRDGSFEIRWLAAEALIAVGRDALIPLLQELVDHSESSFLREGAHHILTSLLQKHLLDEQIVKVIDELEDWEPLEPFPMAAKAALESLTGNTREAQASLPR